MLPNSTIMRIMEDPEAEKEADRLSQRITSSAPDDVRREMGSRLNADFSDVRFHSDANSVNRSHAMGARAWAQGRDVYFGRGGFSPSVAAHELVHTVQQGAVRGNVSRSMPLGVVQREPEDEEPVDDMENLNIGAELIKRGMQEPEENLIEEPQENLIEEPHEEPKKQPDQKKKKKIIMIQPRRKYGAGNNENVEDNLNSTESDIINFMSVQLSSRNGQRVYKRFEKSLKTMIEKGAGRRIAFTKQQGIRFIAAAAMKDYSSKGILTSIMLQNITRDKDLAKDVAYQYEQYFDLLTERLGKYGLEDVAMSTELIAGLPKFEHPQPDAKRKRAYESEMPSDEKEDLVGKRFNPNNDPELQKIQDEIDSAEDARRSYQIFAAYAGNPAGFYDESGLPNSDLHLELFKNKLKHMTRVVHDFPELRGKIGDLSNLSPVVGGSSVNFEKGYRIVKSLPKQGKTPHQRVEEIDTSMNDRSPLDIRVGQGSAGGQNKINLSYNAQMDQLTRKAEELRQNRSRGYSRNYSAPNADYAGTSALGEGLASLLPNAENQEDNEFIQNSGQIEDSIIKAAVYDTDIFTEEQKNRQIKTYNKKVNRNGNITESREVDLNSLYSVGQSSFRSTKSSKAFFSEAFQDVYAHGKKANPLSKEVVKEYERRQTQLTENKFNRRRQRSFFRKFLDFFLF